MCRRERTVLLWAQRWHREPETQLSIHGELRVTMRWTHVSINFISRATERLRTAPLPRTLQTEHSQFASTCHKSATTASRSSFLADTVTISGVKPGRCTLRTYSSSVERTVRRTGLFPGGGERRWGSRTVVTVACAVLPSSTSYTMPLDDVNEIFGDTGDSGFGQARDVCSCSIVRQMMHRKSFVDCWEQHQRQVSAREM